MRLNLLTTYLSSITLLCFLLLIETKNISNTITIITITVTSRAVMIPTAPPITAKLLDVLIISTE